MKVFKIIFLALSLLSLGTINTLSVQDLIDSGQLPEIEIDLAGDKNLDLNNKDLTNLEGLQNIPNIDQVKTLHLENNQLTQLQPNTFNGFTRVELIFLNNNQLTQLSTNAFDGLTQLKFLFLNNNHLTYLHPNIFNNLTALKWLWLSNNQLTLLHPNTFNSLLNAWVRLRNNYLNFKEINLKNNYDALLRHDEQKNPFDLAIKKFGQEKNIFNALRAREMGLQQLVRPLHVSKKRKRDSSGNESPAKRIKS